MQAVLKRDMGNAALVKNTRPAPTGSAEGAEAVTSLRFGRPHEAENHDAGLIDIAAVRGVEDVPVADHRSSCRVADVLHDSLGRNGNPRIVDRDLIASVCHARCRDVAIGDGTARQVTPSGLQQAFKPSLICEFRIGRWCRERDVRWSKNDSRNEDTADEAMNFKPTADCAASKPWRRNDKVVMAHCPLPCVEFGASTALGSRTADLSAYSMIQWKYSFCEYEALCSPGFSSKRSSFIGRADALPCLRRRCDVRFGA